eukprot:RCo000337
MPSPPLCTCGQLCALKQTITPGPNYGRPFFGCRDSRCGFFQWLPQDSAAAQMPSAGASAAPATLGPAAAPALPVRSAESSAGRGPVASVTPLSSSPSKRYSANFTPLSKLTGAGPPTRTNPLTAASSSGSGHSPPPPNFEHKGSAAPQVAQASTDSVTSGLGNGTTLGRPAACSATPA